MQTEQLDYSDVLSLLYPQLLDCLTSSYLQRTQISSKRLALWFLVLLKETKLHQQYHFNVTYVRMSERQDGGGLIEIQRSVICQP